MPFKNNAPQTIILVGLMGAGKTSTGRLLASYLDIPFVDADAEIERAAGYTVSEIFERFGEKAFRDGEVKVIKRLLEGEPKVIATGGGAFMNESLRNDIKSKALSIWLRSDIDTLFDRVIRTNHRPLLQKENPKEVLEKLMQERYPIYEQADIIVDSLHNNVDKIAKDTLNKIEEFLSRN